MLAARSNAVGRVARLLGAREHDSGPACRQCLAGVQGGDNHGALGRNLRAGVGREECGYQLRKFISLDGRGER